MSPLSCGFVRVLTGLEKSEIPLSCSFIFLFIHDTNILDNKVKLICLELSGIVAIFPLENRRDFARDFVEHPNLQIERFRIVNLPALSTKLNLEHLNKR